MWGISVQTGLWKRSRVTVQLYGIIPLMQMAKEFKRVTSRLIKWGQCLKTFVITTIYVVYLSEAVRWNWGEILHNLMGQFRFVGAQLFVKSYIGAKLFAKDNLWQYTQLLRPHYWKTPLESLLKNLSSKANFFKFSINYLIAWIDLTLQRDTVIF